MNRKNLFLTVALLGTATYAAACLAQPVVDIEGHGNLRDAQAHIVEAWSLIGNAQQANNDRLGGHAGRARELLIQADQELRLAADSADNGGRAW